MRVPAAQAVFVGDETRDVEAARTAGLRMLAVGWGYAASTALEGADGFCETVEALGAALGMTPSMGARN
jgi:phosphoglycolate phosphatase